MDPTAFSYGMAATMVFYATAAVAIYERRCVWPAVCAGMLLVSWGVSNLLWMLWGREAVLWANPVMDLACGTFVALLYRREPMFWRAALALVFLTQSLMHVWYWTWRPSPYSYHLALNLGFALSLAIVAYPGGGYVAGRVGAWMRRSAVWRRLALPRSGRKAEAD